MAHTGIYATSAECTAKAGDNYDSTNVTEELINGYCKQAEGLINSAARYVFAVDLTAFTAMPAGGKYLLTEIATNIVEIYMIGYNMRGDDGNKNRIISEDQINIARDAALRGLGMLRDKKIVEFIKTGA